MFSSGDGFLEHLRTEELGRSKEDNVNVAFKNLLVRVKADKEAVFINGDTIAPFGFKSVHLSGSALLIDVRSNDEFDVIVGSEGVVDSSASTTAATDDTELEDVVFTRVHSRRGKGGRGGYRSGKNRAIDKKFTTRMHVHV